MGDELENPYADEAVTGAADADAPQDPVQAAKDDAWLAQFRADNAAKVMEYEFKATAETQSEIKAAEGQRDYDLHKAGVLDKDAAESLTSAAALEAKAKADAARHDEYEAKAQTERHYAESGTRLAGDLRVEAGQADAEAKRLGVELHEEYDIFKQSRSDYEIMQEQAVAAQRIATDEAKLPHPGDPAPADPAADHHQP
jgi:hypothetical protein